MDPKAVPKQLTDNTRLGRASEAAHDISIIDNTLYIAGPKFGRASDWYDDVTKVPPLWDAVAIVTSIQVFQCVE